MIKNKKLDYLAIDLKLIAWFKKLYIPVARISIFLIFFWFGILKIIGLSPAGPLATALIDRTVGGQYLIPSFLYWQFMNNL